MTLIKADRGMDVAKPSQTGDPLLLMLGVGRQLWEEESGDSFVDRLRSEDSPVPPVTRHAAGSRENLNEAVWGRVRKHQGQQFHTVTGLPFTFEVEGSGVWFFRNGKRVNRKLTRTQLEKAIPRCPLRSTTEINDLMDFAYLFAVMMDPRIREQAW